MNEESDPIDPVQIASEMLWDKISKLTIDQLLARYLGALMLGSDLMNVIKVSEVEMQDNLREELKDTYDEMKLVNTAMIMNGRYDDTE